MITREEALQKKIDESLKELHTMGINALGSLRLAKQVRDDERKFIWNLRNVINYGEEIRESAKWLENEIKIYNQKRHEESI